MSREGSLIKNTLIITIGKVCTQLIQFFLLPLYTGILTTEEYGTVDLLNTLVALLLPIITFQVEQALFRELLEYRKDEEKKSEIISSSFFTVILQIVIYLVIFFCISPFVNNNYKYFLASNVATSIIISLFLQIARGFGKNKEYAVGSFISALFTILFNVLFLVVIKIGAYGMLLGTMAGQIVAVIYLAFVLKLNKYLDIRKCRKPIIKRLWKYSIPLIPNAISWWIFNASDRVIASTFLGVNQNGILAASLKFSAVMITFYNIFNLSWTESISLHINDEDIKEYFSEMFNIVLKLFTSIGIGIIACMPFVYPILINEKFVAGYGLVPISIIASIFNVVVGLISVIYVARKNTKAIANTSIVSAVINIIVHLALIKFVGLYAAVISTFVSFFVMSIYRLIDIKKKYFKIKLDKRFILASCVILAIALVTYYLDKLALNIVSMVIAVIYAVVINRKSINIIFQLFKKKFKKA